MTSTPSSLAASVYGNYVVVLPDAAKPKAENRSTDALYLALRIAAHREGAYIVEEGSKRLVGFYDTERGVVPCHTATAAERALILESSTLLHARMLDARL